VVSHRDGDQCTRPPGPETRHRRSVRGDARTARGLLPDRSPRPRRSNRHRRAASRRALRNDRSPACGRRPGHPSIHTQRRMTMRFMMIVKASQDSEAGKMPPEELLAAMGKYNEELVEAGVLVDLTGLKPSSQGKRIRFSGGKVSVIDGPFAETKELIGG